MLSIPHLKERAFRTNAVIADGIEEKEQLDFLLRNGCDEVQGYYYSKPIPEYELIAYIKEFGNKSS